MGPKGLTSCLVQLQCVDGGEKGDTEKVQERQQRSSQECQAAYRLQKRDTGSARLCSGHTGRTESSEAETEKEVTGKCGRRSLVSGVGQN